MSATTATSPRHRNVPLVIDMHAHAMDAAVYEECRNRTVLTGFGTRPPPRTAAGPGREKYLDPDLQIADMDARGTDMHVISHPTVSSGTSWATPAHENTLVQRVNDTLASWVQRHPTRFVGSFVLPLQDMDLTVAELHRATDTLDMRIANLQACVGNRYLGHPSFKPFWDAAYAKNIVVFIHPEGTTDPWYQDYSLWNSVGQPVEEAKVMSSLIYEGIFDQYPGIKIVMSHGGGYLPHYTGRMDRNITNMPDSIRNISRKPSDYLKDFYYDTCTYDPQTLAKLIDRVGADRIILGSDYPTGEKDPVNFVEQAKNVNPHQLADIAGGTLKKLLS